MILVDTSVWVDHLNHGDDELVALLNDHRIQIHPFIIGELACGTLRNRQRVLMGLGEIPSVEMVANRSVIDFIEQHTLFGVGIGWVDVHLLAATARTEGCQLWTRDKRLHTQAERLSLAKAGFGV